MCDPLTTGLALTAASTGANMIGQNQANRARKSALAGERARQDKLGREADALNDRSRDRYNDFEGQQGDKASALADYFVEAPQSAAGAVDTANASAGSVMPSATNDIVQREIDKQSGDAAAFTGQQGTARGALRSFGDLLGGVSLDQARDAGYIGQINGFRQGSSSVLPHELEAANQKGAGMRFLGDILGAGGSIATPMGINAATQAGTLPSWLSLGSSPTVSQGASALASSARPIARPAGLTGYL